MHASSELGVAVVGLGRFGSKRIQALGADGRARLRVVGEVLPGRSQSVAKDFACAHTEDWERAVTWPGVQIVIVSTPTQALSEIAAAAVQAGKHVLVEKPFGRNADEVWPIVAAAEQKHLCLKVGYNHRYHPGLAKAHALLEEGAIGRLHFLRCVYGHGGRSGYEQEWRTQPRSAGGGQLLDQGVHALDLFRWFAGGFTQVKACATTAFWPIAPLEDNIFAVLEAANGSVASLHASWTQWKATFLFEVSGEEGYLSVQGLGGSYGPERLYWGRRGELGSRPAEEWCEFEGPDESLRAEWADFLDCVLKGRQPSCSGRDGWQTLVLADAIYRSARAQGVTVPTAGDEQVLRGEGPTFRRVNTMKALVTGGAGFIGSHIADGLLARGYGVRVFDNLEPRVHPRGKPSYLSREIDFCQGDIRDKRMLERALEGVGVIFHAAAYQDYMWDYSKFFDTNVTGTALIFEIIREKRLPVERFILSSSQAVYGEGQFRCLEHGFQMPTARTTEQLERGEWNPPCERCGRALVPVLLEEQHTHPVTSYGLTKYFQELVAMRLGRIVGVPAVALRYSITQGARQSFYNAYSGICRIFTRTLRSGKAPVVFEDGLQQRDYVHIADVVRANLLALEDRRTDYQAYNVGTGRTTTVLEYARRLAKKMGLAIAPVVPGIFRVGDVRHTVSGIEKISRLGWSPTKGLEEVFDDYLAWLDTVPDAADYFTPAYSTMKEAGVIRAVREETAAAMAGMVNAACSPQS